MTGLGPNRPKYSTFHESISGPINHRDASSGSGPWKKQPTPISAPTNRERPPRPHDDRYPFGSDSFDISSRGPGNHNVRQTILSKPLGRTKDDRRPHDNPFDFGTNTLGSKLPRPGNPNFTQTVLYTADSHARKRFKLDHDNFTSPTSNGVSAPSARKPTSRSSVSGPDVQAFEPHCRVNSRRGPPNDAEIIDLGNSSDDIGERVPRAVESSSDPILLHAFETHPTEFSLPPTNKGKGRAKEPELVVEGSEGSEDIEEFTPPARKNKPSASKISPRIPKDIVQDRKKFYENPSSAPAAIREPVEKTARVDLIMGKVISGRSVVSQMKGKNGSVHGNQRGTNVDHIGTSSSEFVNSKRERERNQILPLDACCIGHHLFRHSSITPLKLVYEPAREKVKVILGQSPSEKIEFRLDRDVCSATVVNDSEQPLKGNVVIKFITVQGQEWKSVERKYKGFKAGGDRGKEALTFLFSTMKDEGFTPTGYQMLVTGIKKAIKPIENIVPSGGTGVWELACQPAEMFEQIESRQKQDRNPSATNEPSAAARSLTPSSSTSVKTQASRPEFKLQNGDLRSFVPKRRSARQSVPQFSKILSSPPPPPQLEPDEIILMYPPSGTGGLSIMQSDLRRLEPEEYLNDTLIEFGLKLWLNDLREKDPALADQIHVFSSFFYKKLNNKKSPEDGYKSVRKWTSKIDLFKKKYIIVPINENIHWYLAVIYEPGHTLEPPFPPCHTRGRLTRKRKQTQEPGADTEVTVSEPVPREVSSKRLRFFLGPEGEQDTDISSMDATRGTTPSSTRDEETVIDKPHSLHTGSESVSATSSEVQIRDSSPIHLLYPPSEGMDVDVDMSTTDAAPDATHEIAGASDSSRAKPLSSIPACRFYAAVPGPGEAQSAVTVDWEDSGEDQEQEAEVDNMLAVTRSASGDCLAQTHIFTFDSLGSRHPQAIKVLKQYLAWEAKDKRNFDEVRDAVGRQVQVPVQPNTWDCGIYLLHFVKVLMSAPLELVGQILSLRGTMPSSERRKMWQDHEIPQSRDYLKSRMIKLSEEWKAEKTFREEGSKRQNGDAMEVEVLSSEGEVDIVEDIPSVKTAPRPRQKRPATRLRG